MREDILKRKVSKDRGVCIFETVSFSEMLSQSSSLTQTGYFLGSLTSIEEEGAPEVFWLVWPLQKLKRSNNN